MSRQALIITIIVIALVGVGVLIFSQTKKDAGQTANTQSEEESLPESSTKGTIQSLLKAGKNVTCSISYPEGSGSGTVYVSGTKVRGDFTTKVEGKDMMSHMINDNNTAYIWTDASTQGTKITIDPNKPLPSASGNTQTTDLDKEVDMKCSSWNADNSKFSVPGNVTFQDMSEMMKNLPTPGGTGMPKMDSSICNQITDASAKAQCLKSLGN